MTTTRRSLMWPLVIMAVGVIWLLMTAGTIPDAAGDILLRAWPALLVLFGLDVLVGRSRLHVGRWAIGVNLIGLLITIGLLAVVVWFAYDKQADVVRTDHVETFSQPLDEGVTRINLDISVDRTAVTIVPAEVGSRDLWTQFKGSNESDVKMVWSVDGDAGLLRVTETHSGTIPRLEDYGRGTLEVRLPAGVNIELFDLQSGRGDIQADFAVLTVQRLQLSAKHGNVTVNLPAGTELQGGLIKSEDGQLTVNVPSGMVLTLSLAGGSGRPNYDYDTIRYDELSDGTLKPEVREGFQVALNLFVKSGARVQVNNLE